VKLQLHPYFLCAVVWNFGLQNSEAKVKIEKKRSGQIHWTFYKLDKSSNTV
jgi:hypothetical protein